MKQINAQEMKIDSIIIIIDLIETETMWTQCVGVGCMWALYNFYGACVYLVNVCNLLCLPMALGMLKDNDKTLREVKVSNGVKVMVVGSTLDDVLTIQPPDPKEIRVQNVEVTGELREKPVCIYIQCMCYTQNLEHD